MKTNIISDWRLFTHWSVLRADVDLNGIFIFKQLQQIRIISKLFNRRNRLLELLPSKMYVAGYAHFKWFAGSSWVSSSAWKFYECYRCRTYRTMCTWQLPSSAYDGKRRWRRMVGIFPHGKLICSFITCLSHTIW